MLNSIILALSVSIDSLGIGITYGIKNTKIGFSSMTILLVISFIFTCSSFFIGGFIRNLFSDFFIHLISSAILICLGIFVMRDPIPFDFDNSHGIDIKESFALGFALSLDSICVRN